MQCLPNIFEQDALFPSKSREGCSVGHTLRALDAGHVKVEVLQRMAARMPSCNQELKHLARWSERRVP